jgi:Putative GTPase activating protein for Arf
MGESTPEDLKKRVKELLNESANKRCSECRSKKHKPKYFSLLKTPERGQLGVFCCKNCSEFHLALGSDYATVKSLKNPEECKYWVVRIPFGWLGSVV